MKRPVMSESFMSAETASRATTFCSREMVGSRMNRAKSLLSTASF